MKILLLHSFETTTRVCYVHTRVEQNLSQVNFLTQKHFVRANIRKRNIEVAVYVLIHTAVQ